MDIVALSVIKNQVQLKQDVGIAVMKKAMGTAEQNSSFVNQMLDGVAESKSVNQVSPPHLGSKLDVYA